MWQCAVAKRALLDWFPIAAGQHVWDGDRARYHDGLRPGMPGRWGPVQSEDGPIDVTGVLGLLALRSSQERIGRARGVHLVGPKSLEGHCSL